MHKLPHNLPRPPDLPTQLEPEPLPQPTPTPTRAENNPTDAPQRGMGAIVLHHSVTALMIMLIIALAVWSYLSFRNTHFFEAPSQDTRVGSYVEGAQKQRIHFALDVFYRLDGRYPLTLNELVERNLLEASDLYYPAKSATAHPPFTYKRTPKKYTLEFASPLPSRPSDAPAEPIF